MIYRCTFFAVFLLVCVSAAAMDLNQANITVPDRSTKVLKAALLKAYAEVMVKQSGNPAVMTVPQLQNSIAHLDDYIVRYHYLVDGDKLILQVTFDDKALHDILAHAGQAVWLGKRPLILLVLQGNTVLDDDALSALLNQTASRYGLAVLLPALDLQDQQDLMSGELANMCRRYQTEAVLLGVVDSDVADQVSIQWQWSQNHHVRQWKFSEKNLPLAIDQGMKKCLEILASQYATLASHAMQSELVLTVSNIADLQDYAELVSSLKSLPIVSQVSVSSINANQLIVNLQVAGGAQALMDALKKNSHFMFYQLEEKAQNLVLRYGWQHRQAGRS